MILIPLVLAPAVMAAATVIERRLGPSAAGWVGALPIAFAVAVASVIVDTSPAVAGAMARSAAAHVPAQIAFGLVFAHLLRRYGLLGAAACGTMAYLGGALLVAHLPAAIPITAAVIALWLAPRLMPAAPLRTISARHWSITVLTCAAAALIVGAAIVSSQLAGPDIAGAIAAFPTTCIVLAVVAVTHDGVSAGIHTLIGLVRSLPCYFTFCVTVALTAHAAGLTAVVLGLLACLATAALTWKRVPTTRLAALDPVSGRG